jgi:NAD(P)-dependent dehydrogenase (short-subunit alcohol dehydrogenase family)
MALADARLLDGATALVTGGGGGIGEAISLLFASHGARVMVLEIDGGRAAATVAEIRRQGGIAEALVADATEPAAPAAARRAVEAAFGPLDILVNNVGDYRPRSGEFATSDPANWDGLFQINLGHVMRMTHEFLPGMLERSSGTIINLSSVEGLRGYPPDPVYGSMKAAVVQFTKSLGVQVAARGVRVNGIAPDVTQTLQVPYDAWIPPEQEHLWPSWVPAGRKAMPVDQALTALYLASDLSRMIPGLTLPVDGGTVAAGGWYLTSGDDGGPVKWTNRPMI